MGVDVGLQRALRKLLLPLRLHGRLVVAHHAVFAPVRVGHDGGHSHAAGGIVQLEPLDGGAQARHQHPRQLLLDALNHAQRGRAGREQQHRRRAGLLERLQDRVGVVSFHLQRQLGRGRGLQALQFGGGHPLQLTAIAVVQVHHGNAFEAHAHQALHQADHLFAVTGANVKHRLLGFAQRGRPGNRGHVGNAGRFNQRGDGRVVGRAHAREQGQGFALLKDVFDVGHRTLGVVAIVHQVEANLAAINTALGIDLGKGSASAFLHSLAKTDQGARQRHAAGNVDGLVGEPWGRALLGRCLQRPCRPGPHDGSLASQGNKATSLHNKTLQRTADEKRLIVPLGGFF